MPSVRVLALIITLMDPFAIGIVNPIVPRPRVGTTEVKWSVGPRSKCRTCYCAYYVVVLVMRSRVVLVGLTDRLPIRG